MRKTAEDRKSEILTVVLDLADRFGPDRVTSMAVASTVGVTQAAVFRHFPTMAHLWLAVAGHVSLKMDSAWQAALRNAPTPIARIEALVAAQLAQISDMPALPMLLFSRELNVANPDLRAAFRLRLKAFHTLLVQQLGEGQKAGQLQKDLPVADAAVLLTSLVQGMAIRWSLSARNFALVDEGKRILKLQLQLIAARSGD